MTKSKIGNIAVMKSNIQATLEENGCVFDNQELLSNHEIDKDKICYCGRPNVSHFCKEEMEIILKRVLY